MVKIRLTRTGKKKQAHYRVIVIQDRDKRDGKAIEYLGYYNPRTKPSTFEVDKERVKYWLSVGAQPTDTVARFLEKQGLYKVPDKKKFNKKPGKKKRAKAKEAKKDPKKDKKPETKKSEAAVKESQEESKPKETKKKS